MKNYGELARQLYTAFTNAFENSHASTNTDDVVIYPYLTYDLSTSPTDDRNQENLILDIQLWDNITSYSRLYDVSSQLANGFKGLKILEDNFHVRFDVKNGTSNWLQVPTEDPNIIRIEGLIQGKIDWREI